MKIAWMFYDSKGYTGGPAINALRILKAFKDLGHHPVALVKYHREHPNVDRLNDLKIPCHLCKGPIYTQEFTQWILNKVEDIQPDIFVPNISIQGCFAGKWIKESGIPVINTVRGDDQNNWGRAFLSGDTQSPYAGSGTVFVNRYLQEKYLKQVSNPLPTSVIPSGVPMPKSMAIQGQAEKLRIVYAGRLAQSNKRIIDVVKAFVRCAQRFEFTEFTLIGDGPEKAYLEKIIHDNGLADRFTLLETLRGDRYKEALIQNHIIVLLSESEGMPGALMDGMSCGLVPISTRTQGIEALVKHKENGYIVDNREGDFLQAIEDLTDSTLRKTLSVRARAHIQSEFSVEVAARAWLDFFDSLKKKAHNPIAFQAPHTFSLPPISEDLPEHIFKPSSLERWKQKPLMLAKHIYHHLFIKSYGA